MHHVVMVSTYPPGSRIVCSLPERVSPALFRVPWSSGGYNGAERGGRWEAQARQSTGLSRGALEGASVC